MIAALQRGRTADHHLTSAACAMALARLRDAGVRTSRQRAAIIETFVSGAARVTAEEIACAVRLRGMHVCVATVYRILAVLVDHGLARAHRFEKGQGRFEPAVPDARHDHLVCTRCGAVVEIVDAGLEALKAEVACHYEFDVRAHKMEIYGVCETCRGQAARGTRS